MAPKIVDKTERRQALAHCALEVFVKVGFEKASISLIASKCGVGKGTVYEYFENKEALFLESVFVWMKQIETDIDQYLGSTSDANETPLSQLTHYLQATFHAFTSNPYYKRMSIILTHLMISHHKWLVETEFLSKATQSFRKVITDLILAAVDANELPATVIPFAEAHAINLIAGMDGLELHAAISEDYINAKQQSDLYVKTYLDGIKSP